MLQLRSSKKELVLQREQFLDFSKLLEIEYLHDLIPVSENFLSFIHLFFRTGACANTIEEIVLERKQLMLSSKIEGY